MIAIAAAVVSVIPDTTRDRWFQAIETAIQKRLRARRMRKLRERRQRDGPVNDREGS